MKSNAYDPADIEPKWQKKWADSKIFNAKDTHNKKFYALIEFPYPSGDGLHVGHIRSNTAMDVISHKRRREGYNVLYPIGWDAFGLPTENYAIKTGIQPAIVTKKNTDNFRRQLQSLGFSFDWSREINTTDPHYYTWTQWIFLKFLEHGLAYKKKMAINWCPKDLIGLANEEVINGRCERCGTPVEKREKEQWMLAITKYAERLLNDLDVQVLPNGDFFGHQENGDPYVVHMNTIGPGKVRPDMPFVEREAVSAFVQHWSEDKFIMLKWKKVDWMTPITGGIEKGQTAEEAARAEIIQETGFKNIELINKANKRMHATFFHVPKNENRVGHFACFHFKLKDNEQNPVSEAEKDIHEVTWVSRDKVREILSAEAQKIAWALVMNEEIGQGAKPLLDWQERIKEGQRNWIGKSEGAEIDFRLSTKDKMRFVLVHGFKGNPSNDFFPWLKNSLQEMGHEVYVPELPNTMNPKGSEQLDFIIKNAKFDDKTVFVAHSLGCISTLHALVKAGKPISGLVLVAPATDPKFSDTAKPRNYDTNAFSWDYDYEKIKKLTNGRIAILSDVQEPHRTPYLKFLAEKLGAAFIETQAEKKHFNGEREPAILKALTPSLTVFTTRPDTLYGVTYLVLAPEHPWVNELLPRLENAAEVSAYITHAKSETDIERTDASKEKSGVELKGISAVNPANGEKIPVWIADYVLADYGTGAVMAVPAHDERDFVFAKKFGLPIKQVIAPETGIKRPNEEWRAGGCAVIFDPQTQKYAMGVHKNGYPLFFGGGVDEHEDIQEGVLREVREESGLYDFGKVEQIAVAFPHFYNILKKVNRIAKATCFLIILKSNKTQAQKHESHEDFTLQWMTAEEIEAGFHKRNQEKDVDHWLWFLKEGVGRARELGYDTTSPAKYLATVYTGSGLLIDSGDFSKRDSESAKKEMTLKVGGKWVTKFKLRDWVFSRQRYWGEPIPVIHCEKCGMVPVPEKELPVQLPAVENYQPTSTGESPLAAISDWVNVKCPTCGGSAKRETDTMPNWAGSSWYYLRYTDPKNAHAFAGKKELEYWTPVDWYNGGMEHTTLHLLYSRFWHKFLFDLDLVPTTEPYTKRTSHGLILAKGGEKMSKSKGNVVNPDEIIKMFGADSLRVYEMFMGPFDQAIAWDTDAIVGSRRFIERVWRLMETVENFDTSASTPSRIMHKTIKKVTDDIEAMRFNTAISSMMIALNELEKQETVSRADYEALIKLLAPFAPHVTEELWANLGNTKSIHNSPWPMYDSAALLDEEATIILQINGKPRGSFKASAGTGKDELEAMAQTTPEAKKWLEGKEVKKIVVVPDRLVNIVTT